MNIYFGSVHKMYHSGLYFPEKNSIFAGTVGYKTNSPSIHCVGLFLGKEELQSWGNYPLWLGVGASSATITVCGIQCYQLLFQQGTDCTKRIRMKLRISQFAIS